MENILIQPVLYCVEDILIITICSGTMWYYGQGQTMRRRITDHVPMKDIWTMMFSHAQESLMKSLTPYGIFVYAQKLSDHGEKSTIRQEIWASTGSSIMCNCNKHKCWYGWSLAGHCICVLGCRLNSITQPVSMSTPQYTHWDSCIIRLIIFYQCKYQPCVFYLLIPASL